MCYINIISTQIIIYNCKIVKFEHTNFVVLLWKRSLGNYDPNNLVYAVIGQRTFRVWLTPVNQVSLDSFILKSLRHCNIAIATNQRSRAYVDTKEFATFSLQKLFKNTAKIHDENCWSCTWTFLCQNAIYSYEYFLIFHFNIFSKSTTEIWTPL